MKRFLLLYIYITPKVREEEIANKIIDYNSKNRRQHINNKVFTLNNMYNPQYEGTIFNNPNMSMLRDIKTSFIPYKDNSSTEPNTWDGEAHFISIFGTMDFLDIDVKNMLILLL